MHTGGEGRGGVGASETNVQKFSVTFFFFFLLHPQWQKKWIIQPPPLHFIGSENDESFKSCKRFFLRSAREENWHCEKLKWFKDVIPPPLLPPLPAAQQRRYHLSHLRCIFFLYMSVVYKDSHTQARTHTYTRWRTDKTPRVFDCATVNFEQNHPRPSPSLPFPRSENESAVDLPSVLTEWVGYFLTRHHYHHPGRPHLPTPWSKLTGLEDIVCMIFIF